MVSGIRSLRNTPGNFILEVRDEQDRRVSKVAFTVVGRGNVSRSLERNAELRSSSIASNTMPAIH